MRGLVVVVLLVAQVAWADKRIDELAAGYDKELGACKTQAGGIAKVADGAAQLPDADKADLDKLAKGRAAFDAYCGELQTALDALHAAASYKDVEKDMDARDNKIRKLRADAKKLLGELEPVIHKLIPKINAHPAAPPPEKRVPVKFPSGRTVELPVLGGGTWDVSGTKTTDDALYHDDKLEAALRTRVVGETCDHERPADGAELQPEPTDKGLAWTIRIVQDKSVTIGVCRPDKDAVVVGRLEVKPPDANLAPLRAALARMVNARVAPSPKDP